MATNLLSEWADRPSVNGRLCNRGRRPAGEKRTHDWHPACLVIIMTQLILLASSATLFLATAGAFFLFVPLLSIMTIVLILVGLMLMFGFGFRVAVQGMVSSDGTGKRTWCFINLPVLQPAVAIPHPIRTNASDHTQSL